MPEFLKLIPPTDALKEIISHIGWLVGEIELDTVQSLGYVTAESYTAPHPLPLFRRSTVDGYAVIASDVHGASDSMPAYLDMIGEVPMGGIPSFAIENGKCGVIHTGGMLPDAANAVVMIEDTQPLDTNEVEIYKPVSVGENVINIGEDIQSGSLIIGRGVRIRPAEIGGLLSLGITRIKVFRKPKVGIISTGDEVVPPGHDVKIGQVRDINSYTLGALVEQNGGEPVQFGIIGDSFDHIRDAVQKAHKECDIVVVTAGSSASARDLTSRVFDHLGEPGVLVHGISIRPGKPTILAICDEKVCVGLPGNPVSALVVALIFIPAIIDKLSGVERRKPRPFIKARLTINIPSQAGREDWVPVKILDDTPGEDEEIQVEPIFGKSNLIFTHVKADAILRIPRDRTGINAGERVSVYLLN
jgi:molybdopterin molybdotransferase